MQDRVQLDRVRSDPGLAVGEVEEGDPGNARSSTEPHVAPGDAHLLASNWPRVDVAARRGRLRDHVIAALLENDVQFVAFRLDKHHRSSDGVHVPLEWQARIRPSRRHRPRDQEVDRRLMRREEPRPVLGASSPSSVQRRKRIWCSRHSRGRPVPPT
jgi:hypothetical protein